jgi:hypothetical protein
MVCQMVLVGFSAIHHLWTSVDVAGNFNRRDVDTTSVAFSFTPRSFSRNLKKDIFHSLNCRSVDPELSSSFPTGVNLSPPRIERDSYQRLCFIERNVDFRDRKLRIVVFRGLCHPGRYIHWKCPRTLQKSRVLSAGSLSPYVARINTAIFDCDRNRLNRQPCF